ncbi:hypothetical protein FZO89_06545 [Luteimonas viscosa]|uniref:YMGG-like Gly-zipper n=1 Tax=Luteimonas viscosa TaxID=1132694 RepID=A0A5D4XMM5_9GAMM|nr:hypothetical protein [Luteimonas viscosa]TYT25938.1 hypothetical protein FZO89_06545 [Luteimonas viscosa]
MRQPTPATIILLAFALSAPAWAQKPSVYPAKGQSAEQKTEDDAQCLAWARQDTGIDPAAVPATATPPPQPQGERLRGAARGAIVGEIVDDKPGEGAALGALAGGRRARLHQAGQAQQAQAQKQQGLDTYYRAYGACMQGRGYIIR